MSIDGQGHFFTIYFPGFVLFLANISGERLQDHWSSGFVFLSYFISLMLPLIHHRPVKIDRYPSDNRSRRKWVVSGRKRRRTCYHSVSYSVFEHSFISRI